MAQSDQKTFLGKLARFVTNPTTNWAALDGGQAHPDLHTAKPAAAAAKGETGALSQSELLQIQRQRRKRNRSIREKEFAMLRHLRAGARIEGLQTYGNKEDINEVVNQLNKELRQYLQNKRERREKRRWKDNPLTYLAVVLLLVLIIIAYYIVRLAARQ